MARRSGCLSNCYNLLSCVSFFRRIMSCSELQGLEQLHPSKVHLACLCRVPALSLTKKEPREAQWVFAFTVWTHGSKQQERSAAQWCSVFFEGQKCFLSRQNWKAVHQDTCEWYVAVSVWNPAVCTWGTFSPLPSLKRYHVSSVKRSIPVDLRFLLQMTPHSL